jgi:hypothetical protein
MSLPPVFLLLRSSVAVASGPVPSLRDAVIAPPAAQRLPMRPCDPGAIGSRALRAEPGNSGSQLARPLPRVPDSGDHGGYDRGLGCGGGGS